MKLFLESFLDLIYPKRCVQCGKHGSFVCFACAGKIEQIKTSTCAFCGKITDMGRFCVRCKRKRNFKLDGVLIATVFDEGPVKEMIHFFKYNGIKDLSEPLGDLMAQRLKSFSESSPVLVPVPLHRSRQAERGYNQAEILARHVSKKLQLPGGLALSRVKKTKTQIGLRKEDRVSNVSGAFLCCDGELVKGKTIILVDDVATTFSTLNECSKALKASGAKNVYGLVVAKRQ